MTRILNEKKFKRKFPFTKSSKFNQKLIEIRKKKHKLEKEKQKQEKEKEAQINEALHQLEARVNEVLHRLLSRGKRIFQIKKPNFVKYFSSMD